METIGIRMKRMRIENGLSLREAAQRAQTAVSTYREWEQGRRIKGEPYEKIAAALDVTLYELLTGKRPNQREAFVKVHEIEVLCKALRNALESYT
jgi:transcriptional regulator with XRE-family HTH domain